MKALPISKVNSKSRL